MDKNILLGWKTEIEKMSTTLGFMAQDLDYLLNERKQTHAPPNDDVRNPFVGCPDCSICGTNNTGEPENNKLS